MTIKNFVCELCGKVVENNNIHIVNTNGYDIVKCHKECVDKYLKENSTNLSESSTKTKSTTFLIG